MGSFYMNCAVTRHPFCYGQEDAVLIPIFMQQNSEKAIYMHDGCNIFPLFVNAKYDDYGQFTIEECPMSDRVLGLLKKALSAGVRGGRRSKSDDEEDESIDFENFTWDTFFELSHENKSCAYGRVSYAAIHQSVFNNIISNYTIYGQLDTTVKEYKSDNYGHYGFEHYLEQAHKELASRKTDADEVAQGFDSRIDALLAKELAAHIETGADSSSFKPSKDVFLLTIRKETKVNEILSGRDYGERSYLKAYNIDSETPSLGEEEFLNEHKVKFLSIFMSSINMPWAESIYAGQECDTVGYKVLRNCYAELTVQSTISHFQENYAEEGEVAIDVHDEKLMTLMDQLKNIEINTTET